MCAATAEHDEQHGLTSEMAAIAVFLLGAMAVAGEAELAVALGVVTSAVLAFKQPLHGAVRRLDTQDVFAGLKLLIASFIVLPLLPDTTIDPWQAINPYKLWLLVVLISALSLAGYVAVRWLGSTHGSAITGLAGGLVSSTATTLNFARSSRDDGGRRRSRAGRRHPARVAGDVRARRRCWSRSSTGRCWPRPGRRSPRWAR